MLPATADLRVASETAVFAFPEAQLGIIPGAGGTQVRVRVCDASVHKLLPQVLVSGSNRRPGQLRPSSTCPLWARTGTCPFTIGELWVLVLQWPHVPDLTPPLMASAMSLMLSIGTLEAAPDVAGDCQSSSKAESAAVLSTPISNLTRPCQTSTHHISTW
jgi:hypothetical protein